MSAEEALDRLRLGVHIQAREGSAGRDLRHVVKAITEHKADPRHFSFSTDEQEADSLVLDGHVDHKIRTAIRCGVAPMTAVQMATINAAEYFRIGDDMGSIGPGKIADIVLVDDLAEFNVAQVIANGRVVARDGRYVGELKAPAYPELLLQHHQDRAHDGPGGLRRRSARIFRWNREGPRHRCRPRAAWSPRNATSISP